VPEEEEEEEQQQQQQQQKQQQQQQHSKCLLHTLQVLYMATLCHSTNINTIIEFVPKLSVACQR